jgi:putative DNA primase/helicase
MNPTNGNGGYAANVAPAETQTNIAINLIAKSLIQQQANKSGGDMHPPVEQFRQAICNAGLNPPDSIIDDGAIHRFKTDGKGHKKNGWYIIHADGIAAGVFGDWSQSLTQNWCSKTDIAMTDAERLAHRERVKAMQRLRDAELAQRQKLAAADALKRWTAATPCTQHDYLIRKGVQASGAKIEGANLLIPMRDTDGTLHSLQTITPDGTKMFMPGGRVKGCYFGIGKPKGALIVCEGLATGASIHECTGHAVAVAFNAGNLEPTAVALHAKYPTLKIIVAADNDLENPVNPGVTKATAAARAIGACLVVPAFKGTPA